MRPENKNFLSFEGADTPMYVWLCIRIRTDMEKLSCSKSNRAERKSEGVKNPRRTYALLG